MFLPARLLTMLSIILAVAGSIGLLATDSPNDLEPVEVVFGGAYPNPPFRRPRNCHSICVPLGLC